MATFIYHESFTVNHTPMHSLLMNSLYFQFSNTYQNRRACVRTSLPWEDHNDCPVITGIPMHCTLLNKIMEIHQKQTTLPEQIIGLLVQELDNRDMGNGLNASRIMQSIEKSNADLKQSILQHINTSIPVINNDTQLRQLRQQTSTNTSRATPHIPPTIQENAVSLVNGATGVWSHFWNNTFNKLPRTFVFPKGKTLLSLWISWHIPDMNRKVCPYKYINLCDLAHVPRGKKRLCDMRVVIDVLLKNIQSDPQLFHKYTRGMQNVDVLTQIFHEIKSVFHVINEKRKPDRIAQLCWESFVRDARYLKLQVPPTHPLYGIMRQSILQQRELTNNRVGPQHNIQPPQPVRTLPSSQSPQSSHSTPNVQTPNTPNISNSPQTPQSPQNPSTKKTSSKRKLSVNRQRIVKQTPKRLQQIVTPDNLARNPTKVKKILRSSMNKTANINFEAMFNNIDTSSLHIKQREKETELDDNGRFKSIMCPVCNTMPTQHRCHFEVKGGFEYEGKSICAKAFCAQCGSKWGCEMSPWRCSIHRHSLQFTHKDI